MPQGPLSPVNTGNVISKMMSNGELNAVPDPATAAPQPEGQSRLPMNLALGVMGGGQLADVLSTRAALARGGVEGNSAIYGKNPSVGRVAATKAATMVPLALLLNKLYKSHPKLAAGMATAIGGVGFGAAAHNAGTNKR